MSKTIQLAAFSLLGVGLALTGCSRQQDPVFDTVASQRVQEGANEVDKVLCDAQQGWGATYVTGRDFKTDLQFKFLPDRKVTIWSDFWPEPITSTYKYTASRGVVLTFDTYGMMTMLTDPTILYDGTGDREKKLGQSFGGDIEFEILSASPDSVVMRGMKQMSRTVVLKPLASAPSSEGVGEKIDDMKAFVSYLTKSQGYRYRTVEVDGKRFGEFSFRGPKGDVFSTVYDIVELVMADPDPEAEEVKYIVDPVEGGFHTATPVKIGDKEYSTFVREKDTDPFHAAEDPSVVLNINGNYPGVNRSLPSLDKWYWGPSGWIWGPGADDIVKAASTYYGDEVTEVGLGRFGDGTRTLYLFLGNAKKRIDVECSLTQVEGPIYRLDLTDWQVEHLPVGALQDGSGVHELIKYFTTYFDETTFVSFVPWSDGGGVTMFSGLDSRYLLDIQPE